MSKSKVNETAYLNNQEVEDYSDKDDSASKSKIDQEFSDEHDRSENIGGRGTHLLNIFQI